MNIQTLLKELNADFYTGVPDSQLSALSDGLMENRGIGSEHIIAANEGNAVNPTLSLSKYLCAATGAGSQL